MADGFSHVRCDTFRVCDARAGPTVGVAVVDGSKVLVILKGREVSGWLVDVAVDWAGIELRGRAEG